MNVAGVSDILASFLLAGKVESRRAVVDPGSCKGAAPVVFLPVPLVKLLLHVPHVPVILHRDGVAFLLSLSYESPQLASLWCWDTSGDGLLECFISKKLLDPIFKLAPLQDVDGVFKIFFILVNKEPPIGSFAGPIGASFFHIQGSFSLADLGS